MPVEIKSLPDLPPGLREAAIRNNLVPFIGAGVSRLAGCPTWAEFANQAIDALVAQQVLTPAQRSQLAQLNPRVKLSVAQLTAKENGVTIDYRSILQKTKEWRADPQGRKVYGHLSAMSDHFVTTNYDEWLDTELPRVVVGDDGILQDDDSHVPRLREVVHEAEQMIPAKFLLPRAVVNLHGALCDEAGMVLTTGDYIRRYATDRHRVGGEGENRVLSFLEFLFRQKTVLFVGYGLEELEILEYVIMKARGTRREDVGEARHFLLQGFFSFEAQICNALQTYYLEECGIVLIPFRRDENDWSQMIDVLGSFAAKLPRNQAKVAQELTEMEALING